MTITKRDLLCGVAAIGAAAVLPAASFESWPSKALGVGRIVLGGHLTIPVGPDGVFRTMQQAMDFVIDHVDMRGFDVFFRLGGEL